MKASIHSQIAPALKSLRLPAMQQEYRQAADMARQEGWSYEQFLLNLIMSAGTLKAARGGQIKIGQSARS